MIKENKNILIDEEDVITLISSDGEEVDFYEVAGIEHEDEYYAILQPVELLEGMEEDMAMVFKLVTDEEDNDSLEIVDDDEILDIIFKKYEELLENEEDEDEEDNE